MNTGHSPKDKKPSAAVPNLDIKPSAKVRAQTFLAEAKHFRLGHLPTEQRHPLTTKLSELATEDLPAAIALLKEVELQAMRTVSAQIPAIEEMSDEISATLRSGGRIFLCGCGATGRLSLSLEVLWRDETDRVGRNEYSDRVIAFMAGGDYALVRSIENFEDHPEFGVRQLHDLGFGANDLMIGCTEGGETPFVIGAVEEAARLATRKPFFLYCNPSELLAKTVERSRAVIENPKIRCLALETGPMALAGSTRLQATTALMLATGAAMFATLERPSRPRTFVDEFLTSLRSTDLSGLSPLIEAEANIYQRGDYCVHRTSRYGITVLTDTTERSPTFSLRAFESTQTPADALAWTYLSHGEAKDARESWRKILGREPRALNWDGYKDRFGYENLGGFDFSRTTAERRRDRLEAHQSLHIFDVDCGAKDMTLRLGELSTNLMRPASLLCEHLLLKCALNISSTLVMGRLGRYSSNLMLYVRAANNKLVDRAIRYVQILLEDAKVTADLKPFSYEEICLTLLETTDGLTPDEPAVWRTFERLQKHSADLALERQTSRHRA